MSKLRFQRFMEYYRFVAISVFNIFVLLVLLNVGSIVIYIVRDHFIASNPVSQKYDSQVLQTVYPELSAQEIHALLHETWNRPYVYEPFTQFKERPYHGEYVNVSEHGFRMTENQGSWPPQQNDYTIFLFGGSTTFGYGLPDNQTIASYLQNYLADIVPCNIRVYNFGRGHYFSTQERILFEQMLTSGHIPDMAIFIDGLNDFDVMTNEPFFTHRFEQVVEGSVNQSLRLLVSKMPIFRPMQAIWGWYLRRSGRIGKIMDKNVYDNRSLLNRVIERYWSNKALIEAAATVYDVKPIFVWQPVPMFKYDDERNHLFIKNEADYGSHNYAKYGYQYMEEYIKTNVVGENFFWCADIQQNFQEPLYIDRVHYSAKFSRIFAIAIADLLIERHVFDDC